MVIRRVKSLQEKLDAALKECDQLRIENRYLKELIHQAPTFPRSKTEPGKPTAVSNLTAINNESPADVKVALFRSLFLGREDIYPVRWESKKGRAGYSPACQHEWNRAFCDKPKVKCGQCDNRKLLPVTDKTIYDHLAGKQTIVV